MQRTTCVGAMLILVGGFAGCDGPKGGTGSGPGAESLKVRSIPTAELPELGSAMAPVDEGRLEVAPPADWHVPPRSPRWLARFQADLGSPYPMIFITADDSETTFHVTRDNLDEFAAQVRKELRADPDTKRLAAGVQPVVVDKFRGTLYRRWGKSGGRVMERWMLETVANGRRYTLELRSREGLAEEYLPQLYAVAAGMKFSKPQEAGSALSAVEEPSDGETTSEEAPELPEDDGGDDGDGGDADADAPAP